MICYDHAGFSTPIRERSHIRTHRTARSTLQFIWPMAPVFYDASLSTIEIYIVLEFTSTLCSVYKRKNRNFTIYSKYKKIETGISFGRQVGRQSDWAGTCANSRELMRPLANGRTT